MAVDGSLTVDTKLDKTGFEKGVDSLSGNTKGLSSALDGVMKSIKAAAVAIGAVLTTGAIVSFVTTAVNQFSLMSSSFGRELMSLKWAFIGVQGAVVNALAPAFAAIYPYILQAINYLTSLFTWLSEVSLAFFGVAAGAKAAALAQQEMTKAMGQGSLAGFDKLNVLNAKPTLPTVAVPPELQKQIDDFKKSLADLFAPLQGPLKNVEGAFGALGQTIKQDLGWDYEYILKPIGQWAIQQLAPAFLNLLAAGAGTLNAALIALHPLGQWFYDNFLVPVGNWAGTAIINALKWLTAELDKLTVWIQTNPVAFQNIVIVIASLAAGLIIAAAAFGIASLAISVFGAIMAVVTSPIFLVGIAIGVLIAIIVLLAYNWGWVKQKASEAWDGIVNVWNGVGAWFKKNVTDPITNLYGPMWSTIGAMAQDAWLLIKLAWNGAYNWYKTNVTDPMVSWSKIAWQNIKDWASGAWEDIKKVWDPAESWYKKNITDPIGNAFKGVFAGVKDLWKANINELINLINGMLSGATKGFNSFITGVNGWGVNIPGWVIIPTLPIPSIPRLATGAVIPPNSAFSAVLGDQRSGTNIEAPESLIRQIVSEELGKSQGSQNITITFEGTMAQFVQAMKPHIDHENSRVGKSLIKNTAFNPV